MTLVFKIQTPPFCFHSAKNHLKPTNISKKKKKYEMSAPLSNISVSAEKFRQTETPPPRVWGGGSDTSWVEYFSALFGINLFSRKTAFVMMLIFLIKNFYWHGTNILLFQIKCFLKIQFFPFYPQFHVAAVNPRK